MVMVMVEIDKVEWSRTWTLWTGSMACAPCFPTRQILVMLRRSCQSPGKFSFLEEVKRDLPLS